MPAQIRGLAVGVDTAPGVDFHQRQDFDDPELSLDRPVRPAQVLFAEQEIG